MIRRPNPARMAIACAALVTALALAGCKTEGVFPTYNARANAPIPPALLAEIEQKNMTKEAPILVRLFKEEAELEVWKQDRGGRYALLKTYPICRWSGELGPKIKEGDRQAPEGFYDITPAQMNPNSQYFLAFNLGFPNAYDRAHDRTGAHLMVHGDCSSRGCYAMSDEQIAEIFALGRESFFAGQKSFQVQAYPFRMTAANIAKHRNSPHIAFWKMLKQGSDHFEVTRMEPKVDVCERRYVFNASTSAAFNPKGKCPAFEVPQDVLAAVHDKQRRDELQVAELIARNAPAAPVRTNRDGGMHPAFVAALKPREVVDERGKVRLVVENPAPGSLASAAYSPAVDSELRAAELNGGAAAPIEVADVPLPRIAPQAKVGVPPQEQSFAEKLGSLFRTASVAPAPQPVPATAVRPPETPSAPATQSRSGSLHPRPAPVPRPSPVAERQTTVRRDAPAATRTVLRGSEPPAEAPKATDRAPAAGSIRPAEPRTASAPAPETAPNTTGSLMTGAQPIPQTSNFDSRWTAFR